MVYTRKRRRATNKRRLSTRKRRMYKRATRGYVQRTITRRTETKWKSDAAAPAVNNNALVTVLVNGLSLGTSRSNRIGNRITMASLFINFAISTNVSISPYRFRIIVFVDKQTDGVTPTFTQLFSDPAITAAHYSPFNPNNVPSRFKILRDKMIVSQVYGGSTNFPAIRVVRFKVYLRKMITQYNDGVAGDVTDIIKNSLYIAMVSDMPPATGQVAGGYDYVFRYRDA